MEMVQSLERCINKSLSRNLKLVSKRRNKVGNSFICELISVSKHSNQKVI